MNEDRSPFPTSDLVGFGDITYMNEDRTKALVEVRDALKPFSDMAGELFARNLNASDIVMAFDNPGDPHRLFAGNFFQLRLAFNTIDAALNAGGEGSETSSTK